MAPAKCGLNKKLPEAPLFDVGIYSLNRLPLISRREPEHFSAFVSTIDHDGRFNEVEESVSWTMKFPSGIVAACNTTYGASMNGFFHVHGSKGWINAAPAFNYDAFA